jgi:hypothetical protein
VNGDKFARVLTGLAVLAVAVVAGLVSFTHIETLALAHGYALGTARLLPVSVDGLIVAASLACLTEARARGEASRLSRAGLVLGILATLAANVAAGAHFGIVGAIVNAWPAVAFIFASEILLRMLRAARDLPSVEGAAETVAAEAPTAPVSTLETVAAEDFSSLPQERPLDAATEEDMAPAIRPVLRRTRGGQTTADKVATLRAKHPDMTQAQMAARLKVSERTVRRHLATGVASTMQEAAPKAA